MMERSISARRFPFFRRPVWWVTGALILLVGVPAAFYGYNRWILPALMIRRAIHAFEMQDAALLYSLSHPLERQKLNATPQTLKTLMRDLFLNIGQVRPRRILVKNSNRAGNVWWTIEWQRVGTSHAQGASSANNTFASQIVTVPSADGRRVKVITALVDINRAALGRPRSTVAFFTACRRAGIKGFIDYDLHIFWIPYIPQHSGR